MLVEWVRRNHANVVLADSCLNTVVCKCAVILPSFPTPRFPWPPQPLLPTAPSSNPHFQYAARVKNLTYTDHCRRSSEAHVANMCWKKAIREMGFRYEHRHIGPICLISFEAGHPWRFHVHENHQPGDFVCHKKLEHAARYVQSHPAKWAYDEKKKSIVFASNQSVLYTFHH